MSFTDETDGWDNFDKLFFIHIQLIIVTHFIVLILTLKPVLRFKILKTAFFCVELTNNRFPHYTEI